MLVGYYIFIGVFLVLIQTTVCMPTPVWLFAPDFYYILVAYLAFRVDLLRSLLVLLPLGCILDVLSGTVVGMYSFLCLCGYFSIRVVARRLPINESLYQIPLVAVSFLAVSWCVFFLLRFFETGQQVVWSWWQMIVRVLLVVVFTYPLFLGFDLVKKNAQRSIVPWNRLRLRPDNRRRRRA
jgi:rod shape-determining protein MreD